MPYRPLTRDQHFTQPGPKRILALDGGGLRGVLTLGFLAHIEALLRERHGNGAAFRLAHYFDLIAGTSTGAIIAAALAKGLTVAEIADYYMAIGTQVFKKDFFRKGVIRARYDKDKLITHLKRILGDRGIGDASVTTGLLVMTKRTDTGSPWPVGNNPAGRYFRAGTNDKWISNADYPLWKVVRASTAAPAFFDPEDITIAKETGRKTVVGEFVDGGVSPFNNPSLQAFMYATLKGYRVGWKSGPENLLLVSVGTGSNDPGISPSSLAAAGAFKALLGLMDDCGALVETMMQWISRSPTARVIDRELGTLDGDLLGGAPLLTYQRYNVSLAADEALKLKPGLDKKTLESLPRMDVPANLPILRELGDIAAGQQVKPEHFPAGFDLKA